MPILPRSKSWRAKPRRWRGSGGVRTVADLSERLQALHRRTEETPLFNPVFQLSLDLSRLLERGELTLDDCAGLIAELECEALKALAAPFGQCNFCPTGGITTETAPDWLAIDPELCVGGSWIVPKGADLATVEALAREAAGLER